MEAVLLISEIAAVLKNRPQIERALSKVYTSGQCLRCAGPFSLVRYQSHQVPSMRNW